MGKNADMGWLDDPEVFRVNQMPAHSDHFWFAEGDLSGSVKENIGECSKKSSFFQPLNGNWKFCYSKNLMERPADFYREDFDDSGWDEIRVPQHIEMAGYDRLHYVNCQYPWEGHEYRRPPKTGAETGQREALFSGAKYNPVGSYRRVFDLDKAMCGKRISLFFEGVEQAVYVWLNGIFIGYAEDSFTPSEFDLSGAVRETGNILAVQVHKLCTAAFFEDQDFFRFFGIFRDVALRARPVFHVEDFLISTSYSTGENGKGMGEVNLKVKFSGNPEGVKFSARILDAGGSTAAVEDREGLSAEAVCEWNCALKKPVKLWEHGCPELYRLEIRLFDGNGKLLELVPYDFGFREIKIAGGVIRLNGKRLILCGVNRHEWSAQSGRCIGKEERDWDMGCFRRNHINAVRTCHYPDQIPWYYLCDREGVYVMAETNMETHGSWGKWNCQDSSWALPGNFPAWEEMALDRARTNYEVFKNHTSILFWSLGNESYAGGTFAKMNRFYKEIDSSRLVHYEGVYWYPEYKDRISDVESRMYASPAEIRKYLDEEGKKPFILCEYMHNMGNSLGGMQSYMELLEYSEGYQGGFIWDFIDQAVEVKDFLTGEKVLRYGGDFDDRPSDYEFSGDGLVFADRTEKPSMQEVRYQYGRYE